MKLAIADPPYPPTRHGRPVASRWYGSRAHTLGPGSYPADFHPEADEWDDPARHRALLDHLVGEYDGWAIATSIDGLDSYRPLPPECRVMVWVKPNAIPGPARIHGKYEVVILYPPEGRRSSRNGAGCVADVLIAPKRNDGFAGAKPSAWTSWVLEALSYDPEVDTGGRPVPRLGLSRCRRLAGSPVVTTAPRDLEPLVAHLHAKTIADFRDPRGRRLVAEALLAALTENA